MRYVAVVFIVLFSLPLYAVDFREYGTITLQKSKETPTPFCPATKISDNDKCMSCHQMVYDKDGNPKFGLRELRIDANHWAMPSYLELEVGPNGNLRLRLEINATGNTQLRNAADYLYRHPQFKELVVHLFTPGGNVMKAWDSVGIIKEMQQRGIKIITRSYGLTASAGVILLVAGDERIVNKHTELMMHKIWSFHMFKIDTPDTAEDQAQIMKHLQDNINNWIISRSKLTKELIEKCIYKKDYWLTGEEAVDLGLADRFIVQ